MGKNKKALDKIELIERTFIELQEMWYQLTFNTTASLRNQIATGINEYFQK